MPEYAIFDEANLSRRSFPSERSAWAFANDYMEFDRFRTVELLAEPSEPLGLFDLADLIERRNVLLTVKRKHAQWNARIYNYSGLERICRSNSLTDALSTLVRSFRPGTLTTATVDAARQFTGYRETMEREKGSFVVYADQKAWRVAYTPWNREAVAGTGRNIVDAFDELQKSLKPAATQLSLF